MKTYCITLLMFVSFLGTQTNFLNAQQSEESVENVAYKWAFAARTGTGEASRLAIITHDTVLHSGDELKMMVNLQKQCYVYVVYKSSLNEISVLFPYSFESTAEMEKNYYLPKGRKWFTLDKNSGEETFYIMASQERLWDLEKQLSVYATTPAEKQHDLVAGIVFTIKEIKKKFRTYQTLAERPISIAGNVRGTKSDHIDVDRIDVATLATEISANNFFSRTITIEHK